MWNGRDTSTWHSRYPFLFGVAQSHPSTRQVRRELAHHPSPPSPLCDGVCQRPHRTSTSPHRSVGRNGHRGKGYQRSRLPSKKVGDGESPTTHRSHNSLAKCATFPLGRLAFPHRLKRRSTFSQRTARGLTECQLVREVVANRFGPSIAQPFLGSMGELSLEPIGELSLGLLAGHFLGSFVPEELVVGGSSTQVPDEGWWQAIGVRKELSRTRKVREVSVMGVALGRRVELRADGATVKRNNFVRWRRFKKVSPTRSSLQLSLMRSVGGHLFAPIVRANHRHSSPLAAIVHAHHRPLLPFAGRCRRAFLPSWPPSSKRFASSPPSRPLWRILRATLRGLFRSMAICSLPFRLRMTRLPPLRSMAIRYPRVGIFCNDLGPYRRRYGIWSLHNRGNTSALCYPSLSKRRIESF